MFNIRRYGFFALITCVAIAQYGVIFQHGNGGDDWGLLALIPLELLTLMIIALPLAMLCKPAFHTSRYAKQVFWAGIAEITWPILAFIALIAQSVKDETMLQRNTATEQQKMQTEMPLLDQSILIACSETPIMLTGAPIGLHVDITLDMPREWLARHDPNCLQPAHWMGGFNATFGHPGNNVNLEAFNYATTCVPSPAGDKISVHWRGDFYPPGVVSPPSDGNAISLQPYVITQQPEDATFMLSFYSAPAFSLEYPDDPVPSSLKQQVLGQLKLLRDYKFWQQAHRHITPEALRANGYDACKPSGLRTQATEISFCLRH